MIEKMNLHYSFTNPASLHDEEALTALELAGRQGAKINEVVEAQNNLDKTTGERLNQQDKTIDNRMDAQDAAIENIRTKTVPNEVKKEVNAHINNGTFADEINTYMGDLKAQMENLIESGEGGGSEELVDLRIDADGVTRSTAGEAVRGSIRNVMNNLDMVWHGGEANIIVVDGASCTASLTSTGCTVIGLNKPAGVALGGCILKSGKALSQITGKKVAFTFKNVGDTVAAGSFGIATSPSYWNDDANYIHSSFTLRPQEKATYIFDQSTGAYNPRSDIGYIYVNDSAANRHSNWVVELKVEVLSDYDEEPNNHTPFKINPSLNAADYGVVKTVDEGISINPFTKSADGATSLWLYGCHVFNITEIAKSNGKLFIDVAYTPEDVTTHFLLNDGNDWATPIKQLSLVSGMIDLAKLGVDFTTYSKINLIYGFEKTFYPNTSGLITSATAIKGKIEVNALHGNARLIATDLVGAENFVLREEFYPLVPNEYITCWGDSLTNLGGWTEKLGELSNRPVYNAGVGGEDAQTIVARQGGDVMLVNNVTIPAECAPVQIATLADGGIPTELGRHAKPVRQGGTGVNPVRINGVDGTLVFANDAWTFTRSAGGDAVTINRPQAMTTAFDREKNAPYLMVIFIGQNGGFKDNDELVRMHKHMIDHANAINYIVLGLSSGTAATRAEYEEAMRKEFGRYFISLREYLSTYGMTHAGLTPTTADIAAMERGEVPPQLIADGVHFTEPCKRVIGEYLFEKCTELGIFKEG